MNRSLTLTIVAAAAASTAVAAPITFNGMNDGAGHISYYADPNCSAGLAAGVGIGGTDALQLSIDSTVAYARSRWAYSGTMNGTTASASAKITQNSLNNNTTPFFILDIDCDGDNSFDGGVIDSQVIGFTGTTTGYGVDGSDWYTFDIGDGTAGTVHVVGGRQGLAPTAFSSSNGGGSWAALMGTSTGFGTWGDLNILSFRIGMGLGGGNDGPVIALVDNVNIVPAPSALALLGVGGLVVGRRRR